MAKKTSTIDLSSQLLELQETLEDDILDVMNDCVATATDNVVADLIRHRENNKQYDEIAKFVREIVYDVLEETLGSTFVVREYNRRSFQEQLFWVLEKNGFVRDCPTCYFNTVKLGKVNIKREG